MSKLKIKVEKNPIPEVETTPEVPVASEVETTTEAVKTEKQEWPESSVSGKFNSVAFKEGHVVFNPSGQRLTEVISKTAAEDIIRAQNRAAQL